MAKSLRECLGPFITSELQAVIAWKESLKPGSQVKRDPDERFSDDGSNFRSAAGSPPLSPDFKVQLLEVVSSDDAAIMLLSDGLHSIRATLSGDALTTLEAEIEDELNPDTKGDVLALQAVTVISTPYGLADGRVQLYVESLQYQYHLRKPLGQPTPIEQHEKVSGLLEQIKSIRTRQYADGEAEENDEVASQDPGSGEGREASQSPKGLTDGIVASRAFESQTTPQSQLPHAAVKTLSRLRPGPTLTKEGFEVEAGVNLARPSAAGLGATARRKQPVQNAKDVALVSLLGSKNVAATKPPTHVHAELAPQIQASKDGRTHSQRTVGGPERPITVGSASTHSLATPSKRKADSQATPQDHRVPYGRRKIPENQRRLLDRKDSWFPSLPGQQFPSPNVPIELLKAWNAHASVSAHTTPAKSSQSYPQQGITPEQVASRQRSLSVSSSSSSSANEDIPWSQSPSQPKREMLPPDSTMNSRPSGRQLPIRSPVKRPMPSSTYDGSPKRPSSARSAHAQYSSTAQSDLGHRLPPRPPTPSRGSETVIKGTQYSSNDDEMEMDVPRPFEDPAVTHRQKRSEQMRAAQRRNW